MLHKSLLKISIVVLFLGFKSPYIGGVGEAKCPLKDGAIVYAARNLYNALTREINSFNDCGSGSNSRQMQVTDMIRVNPKKLKNAAVTKKAISIYPIPVNRIKYSI